MPLWRRQIGLSTVVFKVGIGVFHCGNNNQNIFAREMRNQGHSITHGMSGHEEDTLQGI